jgi:hypothetical protein
MNEEVTRYINNRPEPWQTEVCNQLRQVAQQAIPDVEERIQYGKPHFLKNGDYAAVITGAKNYVSFTIFNAKELDVPKSLFEPGNPERKTIKIKKGQVVDYKLLSTLLKQTANAL